RRCGLDVFYTVRGDSYSYRCPGAGARRLNVDRLPQQARKHQRIQRAPGKQHPPIQLEAMRGRVEREPSADDVARLVPLDAWACVQYGDNLISRTAEHTRQALRGDRLSVCQDDDQVSKEGYVA